MSNSSLVIVGSGIKFLSHLTIEAKAYIEQSSKVLYLVNEPAMKEWIKRNSISSESLDELYTKFDLRLHSYQAITNYILETLRKEKHVCVVLYGHPTVFSQIAIDAVTQAKAEGYYSKILPGISAEDCLFADLLIDPGSCGSQSFEATDFLIRKRKVDPYSHLILWQVGSIGVLKHKETHDNSKGAKLLQKYLSLFYQLDHQVILFEASQYSCLESKLDKFSLQHLPKASFSRISTLYIPPISKLPFDEDVVKELEIEISDLQ